MATIKLNTNVINVFPSTRRSDVQPSARYQSESTYTEIIRRICDYIDKSEPLISTDNPGTFIITKPTQDATTGKLKYNIEEPFEFCIFGYYFYISKLYYIISAVSDSSPAFDDSTDIYAYIDIESYTEGGVEIKPREELKGRDETELDSDTRMYTGVKFTDVAPTAIDDKKHYIHLFSRTAEEAATSQSDWSTYVYVNSLQKISNISMQTDIDGGVII